MTWKPVCSVGDVAVNAIKKFDVGGILIVVANLGGEFRAYPPLCPHMEEPLAESGLCSDGVLTCTKHLWQWNMRTGEKMGPAERDLLMYPVKQEGGKIYALVERELAYEYEEAE
jgi:toluene monooxygenase system ferredoxin subunit